MHSSTSPDETLPETEPSQPDITLLLATTDEVAFLRAATQPGVAAEDALRVLLDRAASLVHNEPGIAEELCLRCRAASQTLGAGSLQARASYVLARVFAERGDLDVAMSHIDDARVQWLSAGDEIAALRTDLGRMQVLDDLGRHAEAARVGRALIDALSDMDAAGPADEELTWLRGAAMENIGIASGFIGAHDEAMQAYLGAEDAYRTLGMQVELTRVRANRGVELIELGLARQAVDLLAASAREFSAADDRVWHAQCLRHIARGHGQLGSLVEALGELETARSILDDVGADAEAARTRVSIASLYADVGLYHEAQAEARSSLAQLESAGMSHDAAEAQLTLGIVAMNLGHPEEAFRLLRRAGERFGDVGDVRQRAQAQLAEAVLAAAQHDLDDARRLALDAAATFEAGGWMLQTLWAHLCLADLADLADEEDELRSSLSRAGTIVDALQLRRLRPPYLRRLAALRRREGDLVAAEALLRELIAEVEAVGGGLPSHVARTALRQERDGADDELVDLLVQRGSSSDLLAAERASDAAKAQTLAELISGTVGPGARPPTDVAARIADVEADLNASYSRLVTGDDHAQRAAVRVATQALEQELSALRQRSVPAARPPAPSPSPSPSPEVCPTQPSQGSPTTLSFHVVGDDVITFLAIGGDIVTRRLVGVRGAVDEHLVDLATDWSRFRLGSALTTRHMAALTATTQRHLQSLYGVLIAPLAGDLAHAPSDRLVVVPHRQLHQVPFHALHTGDTYLLERWTVSTALRRREARDGLRAGRGTAGRDAVLIVAVPDGRAPGIAAEASTLHDALVGSSLLLGPAARVAEVIDAMPGHSIIHIACHGLHRAGNTLFSSLRLADRWLTAAEIVEIDVSDALVVLSSCESGRQGPSAEPTGLPWAFLAAGARGVVASKWIVHDEVATDLATEFYSSLSSGGDPAHALRTAQLAIARGSPHPYYWAPFALVTATA